MLEQDNVIDVSVEPRQIPPMQGWQWIVQAFQLFKQAPTAWLGITGVFVLAMIVMSLIPVIGSLMSTLLGPVLLGGFMFAAQKQTSGETPELNDLFAGFRLRLGELIKVGVLYLFGTMLVMLLMAGILAGAAYLGWFSIDKSVDTFSQLGAIWPMMILILAAFSVVYSTYFYAPTLVMLQGYSAGEAMKLSFLAFWRNWQPILVMSIFLGMALAILLIPFVLCAILVILPSLAIPLSQGVLLSLIISSVILCVLMIPIILLTNYVCYADVFETSTEHVL